MAAPAAGRRGGAHAWLGQCRPGGEQQRAAGAGRENMEARGYNAASWKAAPLLAGLVGPLICRAFVTDENEIEVVSSCITDIESSEAKIMQRGRAAASPESSDNPRPVGKDRTAVGTRGKEDRFAEKVRGRMSHDKA